MNLFPHLSAPLARACWSEGRRYIGAEIDPRRRDEALTAFAEWRAG